MRRLILLVMAMLVLTGCQAVAPWERGILAKPEMQLDADPLDGSLLQQVYESKEASSGGVGAAGAGCGCN